jgi:2-methylisocitrate lyase-like PEP mutase family enzyme
VTKSDLLRVLHQGPRLLVLPNAWDAASARIFERAGFPALATTSAGVAFALGYPDGEHVSRAEMLEVVARIARAVKIPVTADVEAGYDDAVETARGAWAAGAVGMNLEDTAGAGLVDIVPGVHAIREAVPGMVINARTDIFLNAIGDEATRFERAVERLNAYRDAGADCLFAPGVRDRDTIGRLVRAVRGPLNILAVAGSPPIAELEKLGVARVSVGSGPMRATLGLVDRIARELHDQGTYDAMTDGAIPYAEVNRLLGSD